MTKFASSVSQRAAGMLRLGLLSPMTIAVLTTVVFVTIPLLPQLDAPLLTPDEGLLVTYPGQLLLGRWPNRDFFTVYGPGGLALLAGAFKVAGLSVVVERLVGLGYHIAIAAGVMMLLRGRGALTAGVGGIISAFLLMGLGLPAYAWLGAMAGLIWSVGLLQGEPSKRRVVLAGFIAALSIAWRPDIAPAVIVVNVVLTAKSTQWRPWLIGALLGFVPLVVHCAVAGADLYRNIVSTRLPSSELPSPLSLSPVLMISVGVIVASVFALCWRALRAPSRSTVATAGMALLLLPQGVQSIDSAHLLFVGCLLVPLAFVEVLPPPEVWRSIVARYGKSFSVTCSWLALTILLVSLVVKGLLMSVQFPTAWLTHGARSLPVAGVTNRDDLEILIREANRRIPPGGRVFIGATDMAVPNFSDIVLYHMLPEYVPSSYFLESVPGPDEAAQLAADISSADVLFLSEVPESERRKIWPYSIRGSEAANEVVSSQFCLGKQAGHTLLFFKCHR
jgi:hypothetical protein